MFLSAVTLLIGALWWLAIVGASMMNIAPQPINDASAARMFLTAAVVFGAAGVPAAVALLVGAVATSPGRRLAVAGVAALTLVFLIYRYVGLTQEQDVFYRGYAESDLVLVLLGWGFVAIGVLGTVRRSSVRH